MPFLSDTDLEAALDEAEVPQEAATAVIEANEQSRIDGLRSALSLLAILALVAIPITRGIPTVQPGSEASVAAPPG